MIKDYNFFWVLNNRKVKWSSDWISYFFKMLSFRTDTYLENICAENIGSFRYLFFNAENSLETKIVSIDFSTYRRLIKKRKKVWRDDKRKRVKNF